MSDLQRAVRPSQSISSEGVDAPLVEGQQEEVLLKQSLEYVRKQGKTKVKIPRKFGFLFLPASFKGAHGGRGSAKTQSFASALTILGTTENLRAICGREIQNSIAESAKAAIENKIREYNLMNWMYNCTDSYIENRLTGSLFTFKGLKTNPGSITSAEGINVLWIEEANGVSQKSLDLALPTIRGNKENPRAESWFSWNPRDKMDPIEQLLRGPVPLPDSIVVEVNWRDNPWFPANLERLRAYDQGRDVDRYEHIWEGSYIRVSNARVFKNWRVEEFETPPDTAFNFGADWGFSIDPSVLIRSYIVDRTLYIDREAWAIGCPIDELPKLFDGIKDNIADPRKWVIRADSARPETIDYMRRHGYGKIIGAAKGPGSVEDGIEFLQSFDIVVHPRCEHVRDELTFYSWKTMPNSDEVIPVLADKKNHTIDALRYSHEGTRRGNYMRSLANVG